MIIAKSTKRGSYHRFPYILFSMALLMPCTYVGTLSAQSTNTTIQADDKASSGVPQNVKELPGKKISFDNYQEYTSVERPWENNKMLLLYNVGTGKFLNVGSYWGTHATLSDVPRPFWFQRRNEKKLSGLWTYKRYPSSKDADLDFCDEFAALKNVQVGANYQHEGNHTSGNQNTTYSHAKYKYIKVIGIDDDASTGMSLCDADYEPNGKGFSYDQAIDFSKQKIVAQIDLTGVKATYTSGGEGELETVFSVGKDITTWDYDVCDVHIYASRKTTGEMQVRVQCLNGNYNDKTQKTILTLNEVQGESDILDVEISGSSIKVAGVECMPTPKVLSTENPIADIFKQTQIQVGSAEGTIRPNATYNYVKICTAEAQTYSDTCVVKPGTNFPTDYTGDMTFAKEGNGGLQTWAVYADIDLSTCSGKSENVLSIGSDIAQQIDVQALGTDDATSSDGYNNLHFFYDAIEHKLTLYYVNSAASTQVLQKDIPSVDATHQALKVYLDENGLLVNGTKLDDMNDVVENLKNAASNIQVGSKQTASPSHAIYQNLSMSHSYPQANDVWGGKKFMKQKEGNLTNWELEWTLNLSTCVGSGQQHNENVLSIGADIASWGNTGTGNNIHLYYTPSTKTLEVDAVNSSAVYTATKTFTEDELTNVNVKLTKEGLFINGVLLTNTSGVALSSEHSIIKFLTNYAYIQYGSMEGQPSHATYVSESITSTGVDVKPALGDFPVDGDTWDGRKFVKEYAGNLKNWEFGYTLDLSTCKGLGSNLEDNILSIGTDIAKWGGGAYNIHIYYFPNTKKLEIDPTNKTGNIAGGKITKTLNAEEVSACTIKLTQYGLYVNGSQVANASNEVIAYLTNNISKIYVGSGKQGGPSYATYTKLTVSEAKELPNFPTEGMSWDGRAFMKEYAGNLEKLEFEYTLDLSTCIGSGKNNNENVLSFGTDISSWIGANKDAYNIHLYYTPSSNSLEFDPVYPVKQDATYRKTVSFTDESEKNVSIKLNQNGLYLNNTLLYTSDNPIIKYLVNDAASIQVGSQEGEPNHATYNKLNVTGTADASSAKKQTGSLKSLATNKSTAVTTAETTSVGTVYYPYKNMTADGKTSFQTESYNMNFDKGDYIEAEIDITASQTLNANVFSIGTDIALWGHSEAEGGIANNIHFYYRGKDGNNTMMQAVFVNEDHNEDLKKNFLVKPNSEGKLVMLIKLSKEDGLTVNGTKIYYSAKDDPMPVIPYNEEYAGEIIKFKHDANGEPVLDSNGKYIPVKQGEDGYETAQPIRETTTDYIWTTEDRDSEEMPVFITSRFNLENNASSNEGVFFSWAPYYGSGNSDWGGVGVFADRNLPQPSTTTEVSQMTSEWHFAPVSDMENTYQIYLNMGDMEVPYRDTSKEGNFDFRKESGKFYLQATSEHVYGNNLENYGGSYDEQKESGEYDGVEALANEPTGDKAEYSYWRVFDVEEYYTLFKASNSEMSTKVNLTYSMRDPDFTRESEELSNWKLDATLQGTHQVSVGFDQYTKKYNATKGSFETDYTDDEGHRDLTVSGVAQDTANDYYKFSRKHLSNHARYMGVEVKNGGYGRFYQEGLNISYPGWYVISCSGLSNVGAKLFVNYEGHTLYQPLHEVTDNEMAYFNATDKVWPFDQFVVNGTKTAMPLYNALVAMDDENADNSSIDGENCKEEDKLFNKLQSQVAFYVSEEDLKGGSLTVSFGVEIPQSSNETSTQSTTGSDWTVFDNFHLEYGGENAEDPNLVLDEDSTTLGYLDRSMHIFENRPMRLHRTFDKGAWNTLVLPVSLTKKQLFDELLEGDTEAQLLKIKEIKGTKLIFTPETEETEGGVYLRANKPYLLKTSKDKGQQTKYVAHIYHWADGGKTHEDVTCPDGHFVAFNVTLEPENSDRNNGKTLYDFANAEKYKTTIGDAKYDYVVNLGNEDVANDVDGNGRTATFYGTLCKTFDFDENGKGYYLEGRPRLNDGKSYYMKPDGGSNFYYRKAGSSYGLKGFRCWFVYDEPTVSSSKYSIEINGITDDTTDIDAINASNGGENIACYRGAIYNLNGQKVGEGQKIEELPAGIYIVNGKKYIINK